MTPQPLDEIRPQSMTPQPAVAASLRRLTRLRPVFEAVQRISPLFAARLAARLWFQVPRGGERASSRSKLATGRRIAIRLRRGSAFAWSFGDGPAVLLMHGWGGHAGQMLELVDPLVAAGLRAVVLDAPAHGRSAGTALGLGQASFVHFAEAMRRLVEHDVGVLAGVVAHSGGAMATHLAMQGGLRLPRLALIAPMASLGAVSRQFVEVLGLRATAASEWRTLSTSRVGLPWDRLELASAVSMYPLPATVIVHDTSDREVPLSSSEALADAWGASLTRTSGLGHLRILRDPDVIRGVVAHFAEARNVHANA